MALGVKAYFFININEKGFEKTFLFSLQQYSAKIGDDLNMKTLHCLFIWTVTIVD